MAKYNFNFNVFAEKEKLRNNGSNFTNWFRNLRIILSGGQKDYVLGKALGDPLLQLRRLMRKLSISRARMIMVRLRVPCCLLWNRNFKIVLKTIPGPMRFLRN